MYAAIKIQDIDKLEKKFAESEVKITNYLNNEMTNQIKVNSHNVVKVYDHFKNDQFYVCCLEYCNDGDLSKYIKKNYKQGQVPEDDAIQIFKQIINSYQSLYENEIVHRDIKPDNIFVHNGVFKMGDFGLSKQILETDGTETNLGSNVYKAPEIGKPRNYNYKVDIYSLGVVFFQILFGYKHTINEHRRTGKIVASNINLNTKGITIRENTVFQSDGCKLINPLTG
ncbi:Protein kinase-like domain [Pseudocohnilembus persalinus]|uniref:Protein kinase-like domain n=1 Tax=Pseudocohnilembus persalinus TaxID=266149 RepID=A0A0V0QVC6_PSEPJ|nr:Protein kinase-like domain [Pseudocohnilembus persalinus]|eukprot:KRX05952.1 Protein kinase-like domain [Pseudocohnilembus persalinus]